MRKKPASNAFVILLELCLAAVFVPATGIAETKEAKAATEKPRVIKMALDDGIVIPFGF